jgi:hypothetical protein
MPCVALNWAFRFPVAPTDIKAKSLAQRASSMHPHKLMHPFKNPFNQSLSQCRLGSKLPFSNGITNLKNSNRLLPSSGSEQ